MECCAKNPKSLTGLQIYCMIRRVIILCIFLFFIKKKKNKQTKNCQIFKSTCFFYLQGGHQKSPESKENWWHRNEQEDLLQELWWGLGRYSSYQRGGVAVHQDLQLCSGVSRKRSTSKNVQKVERFTVWHQRSKHGRDFKTQRWERTRRWPARFQLWWLITSFDF